jgi:hypothetical protein
MTHWHLDDNTPVEIVTFIDDHSRLVLSIRAFPTTSMESVRRLFHHTCALFGTPASVLTDNGAIYNAGARNGRTGFESDLISRRRPLQALASLPSPDLWQGRALALDVEEVPRQTSRAHAR